MPYRTAQNQDDGDLLSGTRVCRKCGTRKPMTEYYHAYGGRYRRRMCKACVSERRKEDKRANPKKYATRHRRKSLRVKYGLTLAQFEDLLVTQQYRCKVCTCTLYADTTHVDHDHATGTVRGLLCMNCNVAIGHFRDDPALMHRAAVYVTRARFDYEVERQFQETMREIDALTEDAA